MKGTGSLSFHLLGQNSAFIASFPWTRFVSAPHISTFLNEHKCVWMLRPRPPERSRCSHFLSVLWRYWHTSSRLFIIFPVSSLQSCGYIVRSMPLSAVARDCFWKLFFLLLSKKQAQDIQVYWPRFIILVLRCAWGFFWGPWRCRKTARRPASTCPQLRIEFFARRRVINNAAPVGRRSALSASLISSVYKRWPGRTGVWLQSCNKPSKWTGLIWIMRLLVGLIVLREAW